MSDKITIAITGLEDCDAKLKSLSERVAKHKVAEALLICAATLVARTEINIYIGKDNPMKRLNASFQKGAVHKDGDYSVVNVGPTKDKTAVAMAVELGFPTTPAHPAMRQTFDEEVPEMLDLFVGVLNDELENIKI